MKRKRKPVPYEHEIEAAIASLAHAISGVQHVIEFLHDQPRTPELRQPGRLDAAKKELQTAITWIEQAEKPIESFKDD
jgi:hypothetical protein